MRAPDAMSVHLVDAETEFERLWHAYQREGRTRHTDLGATPAVLAINTRARDDEAADRRRGVIDAARRADAPIVFVQSAASDPADRPSPADDVIVAPGASGFFGTHLVSRLIARGVDTTIITGSPTSGCVHATAVDAAQYGFRVCVVQDAVVDPERLCHLASLFDLGVRYAALVTTREAVAYLGRTSRNR